MIKANVSVFQLTEFELYKNIPIHLVMTLLMHKSLIRMNIFLNNFSSQQSLKELNGYFSDSKENEREQFLLRYYKIHLTQLFFNLRLKNVRPLECLYDFVKCINV